MDFLETPAFPICPAYGYTSEPMYSTNVVQAASARERRNRNWSRPLYRYSFQVQRGDAEIEDLLEFFHAVGGRECGFRFWDHLDWMSCRIDATPAPTDQPLVATSDSPPAYQLTKQYTYGVRTQLREIYKPRAATIRVANEAGIEQAASRWTLDDTTGVLVPNGGFVGTPTTWGGEFDVPVRFDADTLPFLITDRAVQSVTVTLTELRL